MRLGLSVLLLVLATSSARADDPLTAEGKRRNDALVQEGFNLTHRLSLSTAGTRLDLWVPSAADEHQLMLWFAADAGQLDVRLLGPGDEVLASWRGARGEQRLARKLAPGHYVVAVSGAAGAGVVGVKGPMVARCPLDAARLHEQAAAPARGFHWPYLLLSPKVAGSKTLLVLPNNSGFASEDVEMLRADASCALAREVALADPLGVTLLMPLFPRPVRPQPEDNLYLHALSRAALTVTAPALQRVDRQLVAMIDDARRRHDLGARVLLLGFSASGSFVNRFSFLHPERVLAVAVGSPGGWPLAPASAPELTYPVGVADLGQLAGAPIDWPALKRVPMFFFIGGDDDNDAVPSRDSFSAGDEALVMRRFGKTPVARWPAAEQLYRQAGLDARFRVYPGAAHTITPAMRADISAAFRAALGR